MYYMYVERNFFSAEIFTWKGQLNFLLQVGYNDQFNRVMIQGNTYRFDISDPLFKDYPMQFSLTNEGTNEGGEEYRRNITLVGNSQGEPGSYIEFTPDEKHLEVYMYLVSPGLLGTSMDLSIITNIEQTRDLI